MNYAVETNGLSRSYGDVQALRDVTVQIMHQEIFGFIGPDGAGKTTLFRLLTTLLKPDSGNATVLGYDIEIDFREIRPLLGYMPGRFSLYMDLSVEENIRFFASVFGTTLEENYELVKPIYSQLEPFKSRLAGNLSGGMKQKLALCCALIHKPRLLILDEPTTGVDAVSRKEFWEMLHRLKEQGIPIIVSTPYMDEARQCDRVALIQNGSVMRIDKPDLISGSLERDLYAIKASEKYRLLQVLRSYPNTYSVQPFGDSVHYIDLREGVDTEEILGYLKGEGFNSLSVNKIKPGIEDLFMELMQKEET